MSDIKADPRLIALSNLISVEGEARKVESLNDLFYVMANDTYRVVPYQQCFVIQAEQQSTATTLKVSNVSDPDPQAPLIQWSNHLWPVLVERFGKECSTLVANDIDVPALKAGWKEYVAPYGLYVPVSEPAGASLGGMMIFSSQPWSEGQIALIGKLAEAYGHVWWALQRTATGGNVLKHLRRHRWRYLGAAAVLLLLPVKQYVLVPAEVVPRSPLVIASPMAGVIERIEVEPNAQVAAGDLLFTLEDTALENELSVASKALDVVQAEYLRNAQKAFECEVCRGQVPELQAVLEREMAKVDWAKAQLERSRVRAPAAGLAVFVDANELAGRPVAVGERVMVIADPEVTRLRITIPVDDALAIDSDTEVVFYLNINPLESYKAKVIQTSYEAIRQPDQRMAYVVQADFSGDETARLGLRGTAKVYGARAPLLFHIMRRPIAWLRRTLGV